MKTDSQMDVAAFQEFNTPQRVRALQIICGALLAAVTLFLVIVILFFVNLKPAPDVNPGGASFLSILTLVHATLAVTFYTFGCIMYHFLISRRRLVCLAEKVPDCERMCFGALFTAQILRSAMMEGVALFGLIVCLIGVMNGEIHNQPFYWVNLLSYIVFVIVMLVTFPTKERLEHIFKDRFGII